MSKNKAQFVKEFSLDDIDVDVKIPLMILLTTILMVNSEIQPMVKAIRMMKMLEDEKRMKAGNNIPHK